MVPPVRSSEARPGVGDLEPDDSTDPAGGSGAGGVGCLSRSGFETWDELTTVCHVSVQVFDTIFLQAFVMHGQSAQVGEADIGCLASRQTSRAHDRIGLKR
ncbi:hypothetical protein SY2F82_42070 [Streptomyces sp. Y2F8-2]|nr:hypothetical protein SY2F82_42070 [Streptomyces sp. Y2F8-2]